MNEELLRSHRINEGNVGGTVLRSKIDIEDCTPTYFAKHIRECGERRDALQDHRAIVMIVVVETLIVLLVFSTAKLLLACHQRHRTDIIIVQLSKILMTSAIGAGMKPALVKVGGRSYVGLDWW